MLSDDTVIVASENQVSSDLAGEAVLLDMDAGEYYGLNTVGARIWELVQEPTTVQAVREVLLAEFEVDAKRCDRELKEILSEMIDHGLIRLAS